MDEQQQTTEVRETNVQRQTVRQSAQADGGVVASRVVWYIVGFIYSSTAWAKGIAVPTRRQPGLRFC
jgi:hypothetical protein